MHQIKYVIYILGTSLFATAAFPAGVPFPALQFLVGNWEVEAKPGEGTAHFEFSIDLQGKVLVRHNHVEYPATGGKPAGAHDDLLVIYQEGTPTTTRAAYYDSDGYVARYTATSSGAGQVVFVSDRLPKLPRYRLTYTQLPDGRLDAKLEVAAAGKPDAFGPLLDWVAKRVTQNQPATATTPSVKP
jgi:hypothetical protein